MSKNGLSGKLMTRSCEKSKRAYCGAHSPCGPFSGRAPSAARKYPFAVRHGGLRFGDADARRGAIRTRSRRNFAASARHSPVNRQFPAVSFDIADSSGNAAKRFPLLDGNGAIAGCSGRVCRHIRRWRESDRMIVLFMPLRQDARASRDGTLSASARIPFPLRRDPVWSPAETGCRMLEELRGTCR